MAQYEIHVYALNLSETLVNSGISPGKEVGKQEKERIYFFQFMDISFPLSLKLFLSHYLVHHTLL